MIKKWPPVRISGMAWIVYHINRYGMNDLIKVSSRRNGWVILKGWFDRYSIFLINQLWVDDPHWLTIIFFSRVAQPPISWSWVSGPFLGLSMVKPWLYTTDVHLLRCLRCFKWENPMKVESGFRKPFQRLGGDADLKINWIDGWWRVRMIFCDPLG